MSAVGQLFRSMSMKRPSSIMPAALALWALMLLSGLAHGLPGETSIYDEQGKLLRGSENVSSLGADLFGDQTNLYSGSLAFVQTDVSLPGNSALPVDVSRRFTVGVNGMRNGHFGDWDLEVPRAHGVFARTRSTAGWNANGSAQRCSQFGPPADVTYAPVGGTSQSYEAWSFWQGNSIYLPGSGDQEILKRVAGNTQAPGGVPTNYPLVTKAGGMIQCIPLVSGTGEGFLLTTPDGTQYRFDYMLTRTATGLMGGMSDQRGGEGGPPPTTEGLQTLLPREEVWIVPTRVTDRYGNYVDYQWSGWQLLKIEANDGRKLTLTYHGTTPQVATVTATVGIGIADRVWSYAYGQGLTGITLPDQSTWTFNLSPLYEQTMMAAPLQSSCNEIPLASWIEHEGWIDHPSGARGYFTVTELNHGRTWVKRDCMNTFNGNIIPGTWSKYPKEFNGLSLTRKRLVGAGLPKDEINPANDGYKWLYAYDTGTSSQPTSCWDPANASPAPPAGSACTANSPTTKTVDVTDPLGNVTRYTYGIRSEFNDGQLLKTEFSPGELTSKSVQTTYYTPNRSSPPPWPNPYGESIVVRGDMVTAQEIRPETRRLTVQDGASFEWLAEQFDLRARAVQVRRTRVLVADASITEKTTYHDNTTKWVLGQVAKVEARPTSATTPWQVPTENLYDPVTAVLTRHSQFGLVIRNYGWYADGTLATSRDGLNQETLYQNYRRGVPGRVQYANGNWITAQIYDTGEITEVTQQDTSNDFATYTVIYGYDTVGRLNRITPPAGDATSWNPTTLTFEPTSQPEFGLTGTHWRQTVSTGSTASGYQKTVTYFDALWRPVLVDRHGTNGAGAIITLQRKVRTAYDAYGRTTFASYPKVPASPTDPLDIGTTTQYDALGRVKSIKAATEGQLYPVGGTAEAETLITYLSGFRKEVRDPNGNVTTTSYQAFDEPSEDAPTSIADQVGATNIDRDIFGKVTRLRRGTSPELVVRTYVYDDYHRLCKRIDPESQATVFAYDAASNVDWQASGLNLLTVGCETSVPTAAKVDHTYDARNRLTLTTYGDGSPSVSRIWTPDNLPQSVTSGSATWTYRYNRRRLLLREALNVTGTGGTSGSVLEYAYTANGSLDSMRYPSGNLLQYQPNLFGEPTMVSISTNNWYARDIAFHANGGLAGFRYGNGIDHSTRQNTRGLPWEVSDGSVMNREYRYDRNANVTYIDDLLPSNEDRFLTYDKRNRLTLADYVNSWVLYAYDQFDDIKSQQTPDRNFFYRYDARRRLYEVEDLAYPAGEDRYHRYAYDAALGGDRGNVTRRKLAYLVDVDQDYVYNLANQMREVRVHGSGGATLATYEYDGNGRRVRVTEGSTQRLQMYSQAGQLVYETTTAPGQPTSVSEFIYLGRHLIAQRVDGQISYVHTDALGSVTRKTNTAGVVIEDRVYEPYGESLKVTTRTPEWPQGMAYTGHMLDNLTRLTYAQSRHYDQLMGRFMSVDPIGPEATSFNRYWYANNNPFSLIDPDGRQACGKDTTCRLDQGERGNSTAGFYGANGLVRDTPSGLAQSNDYAVRLASEISKRGGFKNKGEADWLYQNNSDPNLVVIVDASKLTVRARGKWLPAKKGGGYVASADVSGDAYWVHGQVRVRHRTDGTYGIFDEKYDFTMNWSPTPRGIARDIATLMGGPPAGWPNTPFKIVFYGDTNIENPRQE